MLRASIIVAALGVIVQMVAATFMAVYKAEVGVELGWWLILPLLKVHTASYSQFQQIVTFAIVVASIALIAAAARGVWMGRRPRPAVQAGRSFGWLDLAGIGVADFTRPWSIGAEPILHWQYSVGAIILGLSMFAVSIWLVWNRHLESLSGGEASAT